ncbi:AI-2E family transporter [Limisphaera sp. VF-2]|jgi:predicted PurR-regulated permease PerM|uniref:AI-2E family transporter n=1 Tax=Limisphaera sp. VF-2 TaxID=3400418 RepID=UPI00176FFD26|nr:AI-2E family transporter [Limisphaera sp.]
MALPPPTPLQSRLIWAALSGLALATLVGLVAALIWALGRVLDVLSPVLWPLAVAGVLAYLLDPVVDWLEARRIPRVRAVLLVFLLAVTLLGGVLGIAVPRLVVQTRQLIENVPTFVARLEARLQHWATHPPAVLEQTLRRAGLPWFRPPDTAEPAAPQSAPPPAPAPGPAPEPPPGRWWDQLDPSTVQRVAEWTGRALRTLGNWLADQLSRLTGLFGIVAGLALIPIYLFYLLVEKRRITDSWTRYLPLRDSRLKEEVVFILRSVNEHLIAFFRGQVLVAMCDGVLYGIGFALVGLPYAFLIGALAMVLTIIPFLGAIVTCFTALIIALVSFGDWQHPLMVLLVFGIVQAIEGYVLQPRILGSRVGLHPMVIIVAIMTGTTLLGGLLGAILAIPLAAVLRVLLMRYIWAARTGDSNRRA